jgi:hypothetical protein
MQMHEGWFSAFRDDFGPTSYNATTHFPLNFRLLLCFLVFIVPYLAFLVVFPGIREKRLSSFLTITVQLLVGALLIACLLLPYWNVGSARILSPYQSHNALRHQSDVGVNVGLTSINLTLKYIRTNGTDNRIYQGLYLNERYDLKGVSSMSKELQIAYRDGKPYPILKLLEYFSVNQESFAWGKGYRNSGHFTSAVLWAAFATWTLQCVTLALLPHHYSKLGILCGILIFTANIVYASTRPSDPHIPFMGTDGGTTYVHMQYGLCFYLNIVAGLLSTLFGLTLSALQFFRFYTLSTCMSSSLDDCVGPRCRWGRITPEWSNEKPSPLSLSETSTYVGDDVGHTNKEKQLDSVRKRHEMLLAAEKANYHNTLGEHGVTGRGSSGFQSSSSLRSSTSSFSGSHLSNFERSLSNATLDEPSSPKYSRRDLQL